MVSRRVILAILAVFVLAIAAACSSDGDSSSTATSGSTGTTQEQQQPAAAEAAQGVTGSTSSAAVAAAAAAPTGSGSAPAAVIPKVTRVVLGSTAGALESNIARDTGSPDSWQKRPMYEWLIGMDAKTGQPIPMLATSWTVEGDGSVIRFQLREGVRFHDGGEFTADDVIHSADVRFDPAANNTNWTTTLASVVKVNDREVLVTYNKPDADWLYTMSQQAGFEQENKAYFDANGGFPSNLSLPPIPGTGPYQFKERVQGSKIVFERVPYQHWRVTPDFPELEYRMQSEASTRLAALLTEEIHITTIPTDSQARAEQDGMRLVQGTVPGLRTFIRFSSVLLDKANPGQFVHPDTPTLNVKVRQAMNKAINKDALNTAFFGDKGEPMILNHFHQSREGWDPSWETRFASEYGFDPAGARSLLAEAGYGPGNPAEIKLIVLAVSQFSGAEDIIESVFSMFQDVGMKPELVTMDVATRRAKDRAMELENHLSLTATASNQFVGWRVYNHSRPPRFGYEDAFTDGLYNALSVEIDSAKRGIQFRELGEYSFNNHTSIPLFWLPGEVIINPKFVSEWVFPGSITGFWTHVENIRATQ